MEVFQLIRKDEFDDKTFRIESEITSIANSIIEVDGRITEKLNEIKNVGSGANFKQIDEASLGTLSAGEARLTTDTKKVFVGTGTSNIEIANKQHVDQIGINVLYYGIKGNGSDETAAIQALLDTYDNLYFPNPPLFYGIRNTLEIGRGRTRVNRQTISFASNAKIRPLRDIDIIRIVAYGVTIKGLVIDVSTMSESFTKAGIVLYSNNGDIPCIENTIEYTFIQKTNTKTGVGIKCLTEDTGYIYYNRITGHIRSGRYGILIDNNTDNGINSNTFDVDINSSLQLIDMKGASGNVFRGRGQATWIPSTLPAGITSSDISNMSCIKVLDCEHNQFEMFIYDVGSSGIMKYSYEFLGWSRANTYLTGGDQVKGTSHYSNYSLGKYQANIQERHLITNPFAGARQKQIEGLGYMSTPDDFRHGYDDYLMISPETNSLSDLRNISSVKITPQNCTLVVGEGKDASILFNHNERGHLRYAPTNVTLPSSLTIDITLKSSETIHALGLIKEYILSSKVRVKAFVSVDGNTYEELPSSFGSQIYSNTATAYLGYQEKNKYNYGTDVIFRTDDDYYGVTHIRFQLSLPALYASTSSSLVNGEYYALHYLWVNCATRKNSRGNNAYAYIGGDTFSGNINFSGDAGIVLIDEQGGSHKLVVNNSGVLSTKFLGYL